MNDLTTSLTDLKIKVEKLVHLHQQLKSENRNLQLTIEKQKLTIQILQENTNKEQNNLITETKLKINELVQEIDNCIALLK